MTKGINILKENSKIEGIMLFVFILPLSWLLVYY